MLVGASLVGALLAAGCAKQGVNEDALSVEAAQAAPLGDATSAASAIEKAVAQKVNSGAGIVVCEPVSTQADSQTATLGSGCGRWLNFTVGGHGELGQTPLWSAVDDARRELGAPNLRFTPQQAAPLAHILGVTHVATGSIAGTPARCTLSYQLWKVPEQKPVGQAIRVTGMEAQVVAQLPTIARQLTMRLGVAKPRVPASTGATPDDLRVIGQVPWKAQKPITGSQKSVLRAGQRQVDALRGRLPLAGMLALGHGRVDDLDSHSARETVAPQLAPIVTQLIQQAPDNALVLAQAAWLAGHETLPHVGAVTQARRRFPYNYLLATAQMCVQRVQPSAPATAARQSAIAATRSAPRNPLAWLELAWAVGDEAEAVRQSRGYGQMSPTEQQAVETLYPQRLALTQRATALDPKNSYGWFMLSVSATFGGDPKTADSALWKAIELDPTDARAYDWGLEIYQPKWFESSDRLNQVVKAIEADDALLAELYDEAVGALKLSKMPKEAQATTERAIAVFEKFPDTALASRWSVPIATTVLLIVGVLVGAALLASTFIARPQPAHTSRPVPTPTTSVPVPSPPAVPIDSSAPRVSQVPWDDPPSPIIVPNSSSRRAHDSNPQEQFAPAAPVPQAPAQGGTPSSEIAAFVSALQSAQSDAELSELESLASMRQSQFTSEVSSASARHPSLGMAASFMANAYGDLTKAATAKRNRWQTFEGNLREAEIAAMRAESLLAEVAQAQRDPAGAAARDRKRAAESERNMQNYLREDTAR